jgi:hypothetical protein
MYVGNLNSFLSNQFCVYKEDDCFGEPLIKVLHLPLNEVSFLCNQHVLGFKVAHVQLF